MYHATKGKVHTLLHPELGHTKWDRFINVFIIILILLNVIAVILETVPSIHRPYKEHFEIFDAISVAIFTVEYVLRVWSSNHDPQFSHSIRGRIRYMLTPGALIDLLAVAPFYFYSVVTIDLRMLRILRLLRFLRLFRLTSYMKATQLVINVFKATKNQLLLALVLALFLIMISSSLVYFAEHLAQPDKFTSIPATVWWSVTTLTTVGYGDMIPITTSGKIFTSFILMAGVALFALPAGIITAGFLEEIHKGKNNKTFNCPHCGEPIEEGVHKGH
jgi:voltage-gated potassium channel